MKIQFISDLHFEFSQNVDFINSSPLKAVGEVLVLAGDTGYLNDFGNGHLQILNMYYSFREIMSSIIMQISFPKAIHGVE